MVAVGGDDGTLCEVRVVYLLLLYVITVCCVILSCFFFFWCNQLSRGLGHNDRNYSKMLDFLVLVILRLELTGRKWLLLVRITCFSSRRGNSHTTAFGVSNY